MSDPNAIQTDPPSDAALGPAAAVLQLVAAVHPNLVALDLNNCNRSPAAGSQTQPQPATNPIAPAHSPTVHSAIDMAPEPTTADAGGYGDDDSMDEDEDQGEVDVDGEDMQSDRGSLAYCINQAQENLSQVPVGEYSFDGSEVLQLGLPNPISQVDLHCGLASPESALRRALLVPRVWRAIAPSVTSAFVEMQGGFEPGLAFVLFAAQQQVPEQEWAALLAAVAEKPVAPNVLRRLLFDRHPPLIVAAQDPSVWQAITPSVCATIPTLRNAFAAGVDFILNLAHGASCLSLDSYAPILTAMSSVPLPVPLVSRLADKLVAIMRVSSVDLWTPIAGIIDKALENQEESYAAGLQVVRKAKNANVPAAKWTLIVPSTFSRVPIPTRETLCDWPTQSTLWRILSVAGSPDAYRAVVAAYVAANRPADLGTVFKELLSILPTVPDLTLLAPLFRLRFPWIHAKVTELESRPKSWAIPDAQYAKDARIDEFLRSNVELLRISRTFSGFADAKAYAHTHSKVHAKVSRGSARGSGRHACVEFRKEKSVIDGDRKMAGELRDEARTVVAALQGMLAVMAAGPPVLA